MAEGRRGGGEESEVLTTVQTVWNFWFQIVFNEFEDYIIMNNEWQTV